MKLCKCGCGQEVKPGSTFLQGHYSTYLKQQREAEKKNIEGQPPQSPSTLINGAEKPPAPTQSQPENIKIPWYKRLFKKKPKKTLLTTPEIREMQIKQESENLTDEEKYKRFFGNLKKWTANKPGWFELWRMKRRYPDAIIKHCVFMDEEDDEYKQAYIYYNRELGFLQTDDAFYDTPLKDVKTIFLDSKRFTPLVNRKNYADEFDIPEDHALSLLNTGIGYARLAQFKELVGEIRTMKMIGYLSVIGFIAVVIILFLTTYNDNKTIRILADQVGNLTKAVEAGG